MSDLLKINVAGHVEKKNGLSYLSWAWAWTEVLKIDPAAEWEVVEYAKPDGTVAPCMFLPDGTAIVKTRVTIKEKTRTCMLPVMNHRNQAIKNPDAFAINTAAMRCMTKAISMHGLGLFIYAGEDLPEGEPKDEGPRDLSKGGTVVHAVRDGIGDDLPEADKQYLMDLAAWCVKNVAEGKAAKVAQHIAGEKLEADQRTYMENQMDSKTRAAIKKAEAEIRAAFNQQKEPA
jgi:hypothetical protein